MPKTRRVCGVPSERGFVFPGWIPRVGTLGWYARPLQGMGLEPWCSSGSNGAALTHRDAMPIGAWTRDRNTIVQFALVGATHTSPGCQPWEPHPREEVCSEGTPHREGRGRCPRHGQTPTFFGMDSRMSGCLIIRTIRTERTPRTKP
jgi:hypothetical protein